MNVFGYEQLLLDKKYDRGKLKGLVYVAINETFSLKWRYFYSSKKKNFTIGEYSYFGILSFYIFSRDKHYRRLK